MKTTLLLCLLGLAGCPTCPDMEPDMDRQSPDMTDPCYRVVCAPCVQRCGPTPGKDIGSCYPVANFCDGGAGGLEDN